MTPDETGLPAAFVAGNYFDKYRSRNPIHRILVGGFVRAAQELVGVAAPVKVLEVGCGPGDLAAHLIGPAMEYTGIDVSQAEVDTARGRYPGRHFQVASAYDLPSPNGSFDLVVACEVLEHLDRPEDALREAMRVCRPNGHVLISVPWEPVWRMLNMVRGRYWRRLGNTPGHVQHFSRRGLRALVSRHLAIVTERRPLPWTMLLARPGDQSSGP